ncbi:MAG: epoxyqueuosine reductase QueH [Candidatus Berkelbacteria bacterium]
MKKLILHSCCAPCLAGAIEYSMTKYEAIIFWYNPNIYPQTEHDKRLSELKRLCNIYKIYYIIDNSDYETEHQKWQEYTAGNEDEPEGGDRCRKCIEFRLKKAQETFFDPIATTLTVSRYKNSEMIRKIEELLGANNFIFIDFKDFDPETHSRDITKRYEVYRQKYCGCEYSMEKK